jgi:hypothetical protein
MPGSNRTIGLALGIAWTSVSRYRRPGSTRIPDQLRDAIRPAQGTGREIAKRFGASQTFELRIGRTRWRRLAPCFDLAFESPFLASPRLIDALDTFGTETVRGFPLVEVPLSQEQSRSLAHAEVECSRLTKCSRALPAIQFDESNVGPTWARIDLTGERYPIAC